MLRTAQEALANVAKHARASRVGLTLSFMDDDVALDVRDDGAGFDPAGLRASVDGGFGLIAMRQRVEGLAGTLEIESEPGGGTAISACIPAAAAGRRRAGRRRSRPPTGRPSPSRARPPPVQADGMSPAIRLLIADDHPVVRDGLSGMFAADPGLRGARRGGRRRRGGPAGPACCGPT